MQLAGERLLLWPLYRQPNSSDLRLPLIGKKPQHRAVRIPNGYPVEDPSLSLYPPHRLEFRLNPLPRQWGLIRQ